MIHIMDPQIDGKISRKHEMNVGKTETKTEGTPFKRNHCATASSSDCEIRKRKKTRRARTKRRIEYDEDGLKCTVKLRYCKGCEQWVAANTGCGCIAIDFEDISRREIFRETLAYPVRSMDRMDISDGTDMANISFEDENRSFYMSPDEYLFKGVFPENVSQNPSNRGATSVDLYNYMYVNESSIDLENVIDSAQFMRDDFESLYSSVKTDALAELTREELIEKISELDRRVDDLENEKIAKFSEAKLKKYAKNYKQLQEEQKELAEENYSLKKLLQ